MTYSNFLIIFLLMPIGLLAALTIGQRRPLPDALTGWPAAAVLAGHMLVALLYTTPWDNYLVATRVWWYDPALVSGLVLGWVPVEEYLFFVLQPVAAGLWLLWWARRLPVFAASRRGHTIRWSAAGLAGLVWLAAAAIHWAGWLPGTYLALELLWALPPIMLQLAFGADILWRHRRLLAMAIIPPTLYLSAADALAINAGTWTINPAQSLQIYLGGILPLEEFIFFGLTNTLLGFGMVLVLARQSHRRMERRVKQARNFWGRLPASVNIQKNVKRKT
jgi:lycopene cyclase domain-containing protein